MMIHGDFSDPKTPITNLLKHVQNIRTAAAQDLSKMKPALLHELALIRHPKLSNSLCTSTSKVSLTCSVQVPAPQAYASDEAP
eukprot:5240691-Pyramimonas_sp.AAC.1